MTTPTNDDINASIKACQDVLHRLNMIENERLSQLKILYITLKWGHGTFDVSTDPTMRAIAILDEQESQLQKKFRDLAQIHATLHPPENYLI